MKQTILRQFGIIGFAVIKFTVGSWFNVILEIKQFIGFCELHLVDIVRC